MEKEEEVEEEEAGLMPGRFPMQTRFKIVIILI